MLHRQAIYFRKKNHKKNSTHYDCYKSRIPHKSKYHLIFFILFFTSLNNNDFTVSFYLFLKRMKIIKRYHFLCHYVLCLYTELEKKVNFIWF